jgi:hypothetical protein
VLGLELDELERERERVGQNVGIERAHEQPHAVADAARTENLKRPRSRPLVDVLEQQERMPPK